MERYHKLSRGFLVLIILTLVASNLKAENLTITLNASEYQIIKVDKGREMIKMEGFGNLLVPGKPMLPAKGFMIALPPGVEVLSVTTIGTAPIEVQGTHRIKPAPPFLPSNNRKEIVEKCLQRWQKNYDATYFSDQVYPADVGEYLGTGGLRKYPFIRVAYFPFSYYPKSGKLIFNPSLTVSIDYNLPPSGSKEVERLLSDTMADTLASRLFVNYSQARSWYPPEKVKRSPKQSYDYVIITTEALQDAVNPLVFWKQGIGYGVNVVTTSWIESNYSGADLQEKIRNFLIDKYPQSQWGVEYTLLVGDIGEVPMRYCYPDPYDHDPNSDWCTPTDYYYADLTGDWDSDGDGYYGEYGEDNVDFVPEVYVGRIPWSDPTTVTSICEKLISFEYDSSSWKSNALLLGPITNYANEDFSGYARTDGADLIEEMISDMLSGWSYTTMYEKEGLNPCPYDCDYPITHTNVVNNWSSNDYGIVNWSAHGNQTGAYRKWWAWDDGDEVPETSENPDSNEISWEAFINNSDCPSLDNGHPSLIFSCSCGNGWPEEDNLGKELLKHGSSGIVASTRSSWYTVGWLNESWGGDASIDYYFFYYLINADEKVGDALFDSKVYYLNNFFWWGEASQQNMFGFCLYGDPALVREGVPTEDLFIRGDANCDGRVDIADPAYNSNAYWIPAPPYCLDAADVNDDGHWDFGDVIFGFFQFDTTLPEPPPPFPYPGTDPTEDTLSCPGGCPYPPDTTISPLDSLIGGTTIRYPGQTEVTLTIYGSTHLDNSGYSAAICFDTSQLQVDTVDILDYFFLANALWENEEGWCKIGVVYGGSQSPFTHKALATVHFLISTQVPVEDTIVVHLENGCGGVDNILADGEGQSILPTLVDGRIIPPHLNLYLDPSSPQSFVTGDTLRIVATGTDFYSSHTLTLSLEDSLPEFFSWSGPVVGHQVVCGTLSVTPDVGDIGIYHTNFELTCDAGDTVSEPFEISVWRSGQTPISGELSGRLTSEESPYRVVGNLAVQSGDTLVIEPGVELWFGWFDFKGCYPLDVYGVLEAMGTEDDSIIFTSNFPIPEPGDWGGIRFHNSQGSRLEYCRVEYGGTDWDGGIVCLDSSSVLISHSRIAKCADKGIENDHSFPIITNNTIVDNKSTGGVYCWGGFSIIARNLIARNERKGIYIEYSTSALIDNNTIIQNGYAGIYSGYSSVAITNNIICWNIVGIHGSPSSPPLVAYNDVWDNSDFNFGFCSPGVGDTSWGENQNGTPCDSFYNIIQDPLFCNPDSGDYQLAENSPCVGAGQDSLDNPVDIGAFPVGCPPIGIEREKLAKIPQRFSLSNNYPNPFNSTTLIRYALPAIGDQRTAVKLEIFNILGQKVTTLVDEKQTPGYKTVAWNAKGLASGIYFCRLRAGEFTAIKKMVLLK